ncbi:uncharacterized protein LOC112539420 [Tetranychus urticae]|uniref:Decapping nuclease n=1 Tax=Tetranychus urticae TaxID=32264 RepID=T1KUD4_TETUR|nr:uncharacterized protein LOC112539420 [Tetranychus urticae]
MSSTFQAKCASVVNEVYLSQLCREKDETVSLEGPKKLGYYSFYYNDEKEIVYCPDKSSLRYLDLPNPVYINCLKGYDSNIKFGNKNPKGSNLLRWILENETILSDLSYDFICNNGLLKEFMTFKFNNDDWTFSATKIRGKIILNRIHSDEEKASIDARTEQSNKSTYVANNLQLLIAKNIDQSQGDVKREEDSFFGVFHSKIGSHQILHSGFLGCVETKEDLDKPIDEMKFVLIKKFNGPRVSHSPFQADTWWALAALAGIDKIVRAKCQRDFMCKNIDKLDVKSLIYKSRQMDFVNSLNTVLDHVKSTVTEENKCYNFHLNGRIKKLTGYLMNDLDENLIPSWYIDEQLPVEA